MNASPSRALSALMIAAAMPGLALAQSTTTTTTSSGSGLRMPYERGFWGHAGVSLGTARLDATCPPGSGCDDSDQTLRVFAGGRFNNTFGGEVGLLKLGDFSRGGGETDAEGLDLTAIAGIPFGNNWSVFAKAGLAYTRTQVSGTAPGLQTGSANGWGPRFGLGLQMGLTRNWAIRADWDRYRFKMPEGRENIDTFTVGAQYTFR